MTTPDFPDFTQPTSAVEKTVTLRPAVDSFDASWNNSFDTSAVESISITIIDSSASGDGQYYAIQIDWQEAGQTVESDFFTGWLSKASGVPVEYHNIRTPARGTQCKVRMIFAGVGCSAKMQVIGSSRLLAGIFAKGREAMHGPILVNQQPVAVAAGATQSYWWSMVSSAVKLFMYSSVSTITFRLYAVQIYANGIVPVEVDEWVPNNTRLGNVDIDLPRTAMRMDIVNSDTVARNAYFDAVDTS